LRSFAKRCASSCPELGGELKELFLDLKPESDLLAAAAGHIVFQKQQHERGRLQDKQLA
jgi:hypothetical protein